MKHLSLFALTALLLVGCGGSTADESAATRGNTVEYTGSSEFNGSRAVFRALGWQNEISEGGASKLMVSNADATRCVTVEHPSQSGVYSIDGTNAAVTFSDCSEGADRTWTATSGEVRVVRVDANRHEVRLTNVQLAATPTRNDGARGELTLSARITL